MTHTIVRKGWLGHNVKAVLVRPEGHIEDCGHDITVTWVIGTDGSFHGPSLAWQASAFLSAAGALEFADAIRFCTELPEPE